MEKNYPTGEKPVFLGIECGGTRTVAVLTNRAGEVLRRSEFGPANLRLVSDLDLRRHFASAAQSFPRPSAIGIGMAGVRDEDDHGRILLAAGKIWRGIACLVSHDLETALCAAECAAKVSAAARVIVLSGTGSCCYGRSASGVIAKVGGWGHMIGDKGSGYEIGLRAMKAAVYYYDRDGIWPPLGQRILRILQLNVPNDLIDWALQAGKREIAALAVEVFAAWEGHDKIARDILEGAAASLAKDAAACARRLVSNGTSVEFVFTGSVFLKQPRFMRLTCRKLRENWSSAKTAVLKAEGAWGAAERARIHFEQHRISDAQPVRLTEGEKRRGTAKTADPSLVPSFPPELVLSTAGAISQTERRNPRSNKLDRLSFNDAITLMIEEEAQVPRALLSKRAEIEKAIRMIVRAFQNDGRLFYVGAGTSGRLGVLDASECPPTFRTPPDQVQGIIAGGQQALWRSIEGAEDDPSMGANVIQFRGVRSKDVVVGIAASGRTPFVWGALEEALRRKAATILICFNSKAEFPPGIAPDLVIAPDVGPEVLTGSTRLKAGTATKLILNMLTTLSMVRMGKVAGNLMIDLNPSNKKLKDRAVRILQELTGCDHQSARSALEKSKWVIKLALGKLARGRGRRI